MRSAFALRIFSGKIIYNFAFVALCGVRQTLFSREEFGTNSLSQSLTALPDSSGREPLARPQALRFSRKLYRHAKGPIPEDDFPRSGEDVAAGDKKGNLSP